MIALTFLYEDIFVVPKHDQIHLLLFDSLPVLEVSPTLLQNECFLI